MSRTSRESHHSATPPPRFPYARQVFLTVSVVAALAVMVVGHEVLLPFVLAALVGFVLFPAVRFVEKTRMPRWLAIILVYVITVGSMVGFTAVVLPRLFDEVKALSSELPKLTATIRDDYLPVVDRRLSQWTGGQSEAAEVLQERPAIVLRPREDGSFAVDIQDDIHVYRDGEGSYVVGPPKAPENFSSARMLQDAFDKGMSWAQKNSLELLEVGRAIISGVSRGIFYFFITLMLAGYMMFTWEGIHGFFREMWPKYRRASFDRFLHQLDRGLAGVVRGQLLICLVNGVLSAIGFWFFELKYWPILALIAAALSIIPIFGSILSTIPAVAIGLTQDLGVAVGVLIWIVAIHQLEANFLNPKIIGDAAKIHPVLVVFALLFGQHFFGISGALLAVPSLALVQAIFLHFRESILGISVDPLVTDPDPEEGLRAARASERPLEPAPVGGYVDEEARRAYQPPEPHPQGPRTQGSGAPVAGVEVSVAQSDEVDTRRLATKRDVADLRPVDQERSAPEASPGDPDAERKAARADKKALTSTLKSHTE